MNKLLVLFGVICISSVYCDVVHVSKCTESKNCDIGEVRIDPCPGAKDNKPCVVKKGTSAHIEFEFTGEKGDDELKTQAYWATGIVDLPLAGMNTTACAFTACPLTGEQQKFTYDLNIKKKFPAQNYDVKWKLWKDNGETDCCFIFKLKIEK